MKLIYQTLNFSLLAACLAASAIASAALTVNSQWQLEASNDGSRLSPRHEATGIVVGDYLYLLGGRGTRSVERYSPDTRQWDDLGAAPLELHHMQAVAIDNDIYILGAFTCCYPNEQLVPEIHVFDTTTNTWSVEGTQPISRLRGSAAAVVRDEKIYLIGGNTEGHDGGAVAWFDEFDPATGEWVTLTDAPNARDHFSAVMVGDRLVAAGGRQTRLPNPSANPVLATDVYDFNTGQWASGADIPTGRAGVMTVAYDDYVIVAGGEINTSNDALQVVEAYDVESDSWQTLPPMTVGRHGGGGGLLDSRFYAMSGSTTIGGSPSSESNTIENLSLPEIQVPDEVPNETPDEVPGVDTPGADAPRSKSGAVTLFLLPLLAVVGLLRRQGRKRPG